MKSNKGITLIALVVTIVVLLILAGVSISMLIGENGIITQAQNAKEQSEIGEEKEAISVAYSGAKIKNEGTDVTANDMQEQFNYNETKANASGNIKVQFTESKRWYSIDGSGNIEGPFESEDEIVTERVNIVISKTPESEPSGGVVLKVEKVEGIGEDVILDDIDINNLSEDERKDIIKKIDIYGFNNFDGTNYKSFNELIENEFDGNEQIFWQEYIGDLDEYIEYRINFFKDEGILSIPFYTVTNPNNEIADTYLATENDIYTFTIVDVITEEAYEKAVEVTNVDINSVNYYVENYGTPVSDQVALFNKETNMPTKFEKAYIYHEGKIIDITKCIIEENGIYSIYGWDIHQQKIGIENGEVKTFILIKDEICYIGNAIVVWPEQDL